MKKIFSVFVLFVIMISITGCGKENKPCAPDLNKIFTVNAAVESGKFKTEAIISRLGDNMWEAEISSPETLKGIKLSYSGEDITASYMGMSFSVPKNAAPVKGMMTMLFNAIDKSAALPEMPCIEDETTKTFSGETENGKFEITVDKTTGNLTGFEMPDNDLKVVFTDYSVIQ